MSFNLFESEEAAIARGRALLEAGEPTGDAGWAAYSDLLNDFERLLKTTRRLVRVSDRNEAGLNAMAEKQRLAAEEVSKKNRELEVLSNKLSKYLSPQVYNSIFTGEQGVGLASQRKKLTVFFCDIADFTETTEKMESEDLTALLNQFLTEMSKVALAHGATIDKYDGDRIMVFFGDPETRGVKEDAVVCVKMALAMQKRMRELGDIWAAMGIEEPLRCRMGIHTGYCTVGNFGSEDRMDYTVVGSTVNLASRLEHEAPVGGVLLSNETHALVMDDIRCEARGRIRVKGVAYPIAVHEAMEVRESVDSQSQAMSADLLHLKLQLDHRLMNAEEQHKARQVLEDALARLLAAAAGAPAIDDSRRRGAVIDTGGQADRRHLSGE
jgi:class 3 adenylate cyclase